MAATTTPAVRRDWIAKTLAGTLLGFALALAVSGLFSDLNPAIPLAVRGQLAMWLVAPVWLGALAAVYACASGLRAWLWLGGANLLAYGALLALRASGMGGPGA